MSPYRVRPYTEKCPQWERVETHIHPLSLTIRDSPPSYPHKRPPFGVNVLFAEIYTFILTLTQKHFEHINVLFGALVTINKEVDLNWWSEFVDCTIREGEHFVVYPPHIQTFYPHRFHHQLQRFPMYHFPSLLWRETF